MAVVSPYFEKWG